METHFETLLEQREFSEQIRYGIHERFLWRVIRCRLDAYDELVFEWMRHLVAGKQHIGIL